MGTGRIHGCDPEPFDRCADAASRSSNEPNARSSRRARVRREPLAQGGLVDTQQPAARVADDDDLLGAQELLADDQRADRVVGRDPARIPDDVGVTGAQAERFAHVEPGVHAGQDRQATQRGGRQLRAVEGLGVALVLGEDPPEFVTAAGHGSVAGAEQQGQPAIRAG